MKILYLSCHEILHWDEVSLFTELGHDVFCPGAAVCDDNRGDHGLRPALKKCKDYDDLMSEWHTFGKAGFDNKERITSSFVKKFDVVIVMHIPKWISVNWPVFKEAGKPIVWRTIGQSVWNNELEIERFWDSGQLKIVRYSPKEKLIPNYKNKESATIRFYKDPEEYSGWTGHKKEIITVAQSMAQRGLPCNYDWFKEVTAPFPRRLFGHGSESDSFGAGRVPYSELKQAYKDYRCYFYTGTYPASYTLNAIESLMSLPVVAIGPEKGHPTAWFPGHFLYEMHEIIENGVSGFWSDKKEELQSYIKELLENDALAAKIQEAGRKKAVEIFGKETIGKQWNEFLNNLR